MLRYLTAGESHGKALIAILEGVPAGLRIEEGKINQELKRRQSGFGRGKRMQIENDTAQIVSGLKNLVRFELLPFHPLAATKYKNLGIINPFEKTSSLSTYELLQYNLMLNYKL